METNLKILPCPFCGSPAFIFEYEEWFDCSKNPTIYYGIGCNTENCFAEQDMANFNSIEDAINSWNKRA